MNYHLEFIRTVFTKAEHLIEELNELRDDAIFAMGEHTEKQYRSKTSPHPQTPDIHDMRELIEETLSKEVTANPGFLSGITQNNSALFDNKEIQKMPKEFRRLFRTGKVTAHIRKKENGSYEIRCTVNKIPVSSCGKTLASAKERFIAKLNDIVAHEGTVYSPKYTFFNDFADYWFETVKKPTVKPNTYKSQLSTYNVHIKPYFAGVKLKEITPLVIQPLFNSLDQRGITRGSALTKLLLVQIFDAAAGERLISSNPMNSVHVLQYETNKGTALSYKEEAEFLEKLNGNPYRLAMAFLLYTGVRRSELPTLQIKDGFAIVQNSKRKITQKVTFRKIPITPMLLPYLADSTKQDILDAICPARDVLTKQFKLLCPNHHLHELRHTFITRCQECGVAREIVSVWAGHAADRTMTSTVYTHFSDDFMLEQGQKVDYSGRLS